MPQKLGDIRKITQNSRQDISSKVCEWAALFQRPKEWCGRLAEGQRAAGGCVLVLIGVVAVVFFVSAKSEAWWWGLVGEQL